MENQLIYKIRPYVRNAIEASRLLIFIASCLLTFLSLYTPIYNIAGSKSLSLATVFQMRSNIFPNVPQIEGIFIAMQTLAALMLSVLIVGVVVFFVLRKKPKVGNCVQSVLLTANFWVAITYFTLSAIAVYLTSSAIDVISINGEIFYTIVIVTVLYVAYWWLWQAQRSNALFSFEGAKVIAADDIHKFLINAAAAVAILVGGCSILFPIIDILGIKPLTSGLIPLFFIDGYESEASSFFDIAMLVVYAIQLVTMTAYIITNLIMKKMPTKSALIFTLIMMLLNVCYLAFGLMVRDAMRKNVVANISTQIYIPLVISVIALTIQIIAGAGVKFKTKNEEQRQPSSEELTNCTGSVSEVDAEILRSSSPRE